MTENNKYISRQEGAEKILDTPTLQNVTIFQNFFIQLGSETFTMRVCSVFIRCDSLKHDPKMKPIYKSKDQTIYLKVYLDKSQKNSILAKNNILVYKKGLKIS